MENNHQQSIEKLLANYSLDQVKQTYIEAQDNEQQYLANLQAQINMFNANPRSRVNPLASVEELQNIVNYYQEMEKYIQSYLPIAEELQQKGCTQLLAKVNELFNDFHQAREIYQNMCNTRKAYNQQAIEITHQINQEWLNTIEKTQHQAAETRQKSLDNWRSILGN